MVNTFNSSTEEEEGDGRSRFKACLVYRVSYRTARDTQRNSISKQNKATKNKQTKKKP